MLTSRVISVADKERILTWFLLMVLRSLSSAGVIVFDDNKLVVFVEWYRDNAIEDRPWGIGCSHLVTALPPILM